MRRPSRKQMLLLASTLVAACTGSIESPDGKKGPGGTTPPTTGQTPDALCVDETAPAVGPAPLRRLTRDEFKNAIADLLSETVLPDVDLTADEKVAGFASNSIAPITTSLLEDYEAATRSTAEKAYPGVLTQRLGCDATTTACIEGATAGFGRLVFRRPLTDEEATRFVTLYKTTRTEEGAAQAAQLWLQALLLSPHFLYQIERSTPTEHAGVERLDGFSIATRMASFIWQSVPDGELLDAAETGALDDPSTRREQAQRLLSDARARRGIASFHQQWLGVDELLNATKSADEFPEWSEQTAALALQEVDDFANWVISDGDGTLRTLLSSDIGFPRGALADVYGVPAAQGPTPLGSVRKGIISRAAFMATHSHSSEVSWVHRAKLIREHMLCQTIPAPPPVDQIVANDPDRLTNPDCKGCHIAMDPFGQGFDAFDAIGRYDAANSHPGQIEPIDPPSDVDGSFETPDELASKLAESTDVQRCVARQWFRYAVRRHDEADEACGVVKLADTFVAKDGNIAELVMAIVDSEAFTMRRLESE